MLRRSDLNRLGPIFGLVWAIFSTGCDSTPPGTPALPAPDVGPARAAMVATLDAWKSGRRNGGMIGSKPQIGIVDSLRAERALIDYEVLGALSVVDKARPFAVRLELDGPRESVTTRYLVLGQDPLWVFRQEDLDLMLHWEHKMPAAEPVKGPADAAEKPGAPGSG